MENEWLQQLSGLGGIDLDVTLNRFMNSENLYEKFLIKFLEDASFQKLKACLENGNIADAFIYAHTLKGVAGNMGFQKMSDILLPLTEELRNGETDHAEGRMQQLSEQYEQICRLIGSLSR